MSVERAELLRLCEQYKLSATDGVATIARALLGRLTDPDRRGVDSLRQALRVSDEKVQYQRGLLTEAAVALEQEQADRREERAGYVEEISHLRQGIALFRGAYLTATSLRPMAKRPPIEEWMAVDLTREDRRRADSQPDIHDPADR